MMTTLRRLATGLYAATFMLLAVPSTAMASDIPNPDPSAPGAFQDKVDTVLGLLKYLGIVAVVAGFILAGILLAIGKSGGMGGRDGTDRLWYVAGGAVVIGGSSALAGFLL